MNCPFTGKPCDNPKVISITEVVDNKEIHLDICEKCLSFQPPSKDNGFLLYPLNSTYQEEENPVICTCGNSIYEFTKTGKLGCPECYKTFNDILVSVVKKCHRNASQHVGKFPTKANPEFKIKALEEEMKKVVKEENYERAAEIRDEIKRIKEKT